jgi:hypothetical protein
MKEAQIQAGDVGFCEAEVAGHNQKSAVAGL